MNDNLSECVDFGSGRYFIIFTVNDDKFRIWFYTDTNDIVFQYVNNDYECIDIIVFNNMSELAQYIEKIYDGVYTFKHLNN